MKYKSLIPEKRVKLDELTRWEDLDSIHFSFMCKIKNVYSKRSVKLTNIIKFGINYKPVKAGRGRSKLTGATKYLRGYMFILTKDKHKYDNIDYVYFEKLTALIKKVASYKMIFKELVTVTTKSGYVWKKLSRHYVPKFEKLRRYNTVIRENKLKYRS